MKNAIIFTISLVVSVSYGIKCQTIQPANSGYYLQPQDSSANIPDTVSVSPSSPTVIPAVVVSAKSKRTRDFEQKVRENQQTIDRWMDRYKYDGTRLYPGAYNYAGSYWESYDMLKIWGHEDKK